MSESLIYDFETLSSDGIDGVVLSLAAVSFDEDRYLNNPYTYDELLSLCKYIKFDVEEQVKKYNRKIQKDTLEWWIDRGDLAHEILRQSPQDKSISEIPNFLRGLVSNPRNVKRVYTRGNTFDPIFMTSLFKALNENEPFHWSKIRDTRSMIEGLSWGSGIDNGFLVKGLEDKFVKHHPIHDISMDVMRMQVLVQHLFKDDTDESI